MHLSCTQPNKVVSKQLPVLSSTAIAVIRYISTAVAYTQDSVASLFLTIPKILTAVSSGQSVAVMANTKRWLLILVSSADALTLATMIGFPSFCSFSTTLVAAPPIKRVSKVKLLIGFTLVVGFTYARVKNYARATWNSMFVGSLTPHA